MFKESNLVTLVTAALIATVVRILLYLNGNQEGGYLTNAIANVGMTVIVLEVCIVLLRFFTAFNIMHIFNKFIPRRFELVTFTAIGMVITFILTNISFIGGISPIQFGNNEALTYIVNRPFEPLPLIVEYVALCVRTDVHKKVLDEMPGGSKIVKKPMRKKNYERKRFN